jgi:small subunit ribosomal protein S2
MREMRKIHRNLSGMRTMNRLPGAVVVVDSHREHSAVREARKMGIPTIALIDTDSDPDMIDLAIPGNDDSIRSIDLVLERLADAVIEGFNTLPKDQVEKLQQDFTKAHTPVVPKEAVTEAAPVAEPAAAAPEPVAETGAAAESAS